MCALSLALCSLRLQDARAHDTSTSASERAIVPIDSDHFPPPPRLPRRICAYNSSNIAPTHSTALLVEKCSHHAVGCRTFFPPTLLGTSQWPRGINPSSLSRVHHTPRISVSQIIGCAAHSIALSCIGQRLILQIVVARKNPR